MRTKIVPHPTRLPLRAKRARCRGEAARPILLLLATLVAFSALAEEQGVERQAAGFVFLTPAGGKAVLRESPSAGAKTVSNPPSGMRVVYRGYLEIDGKPAWYRVAPPGSTPGWIAARDVSTTRPAPLPPSHPLRTVDPNDRMVTMTGSETAAARGLDGRAKDYAATNKELAAAVPPFLGVEKAEEDQFSRPGVYDDHQKPDGTYEETADNPVRKQKAADFRRELK